MSDFLVKVGEVGKPIDLSHLRPIREIRPVELYIKPDGDVEDKPSFVFILTDALGGKYFAQISERMLREGLEKAQALRFVDE